MKKIKFMTPYEECIDEKETIKVMKKHLSFLSEYVDRSYLQEAEAIHKLVEEESELIDFLPYTRSISKYSKHSTSAPQSMRLLDAMEMQDRQKRRKIQQRKERQLRCAWLLQGISNTGEKHKQILLLKYVHTLNNERLCIRLGNISLSTLNRHLGNACVELAKILELEVMHPSKYDK